MNNLNLPQEFYTIEHNLREHSHKLFDTLPTLWRKYEGDNLPPTIKKIYEDYFSSSHYSGEEMGVFEGWQGLTLIKNAMVLGYLWGKQEEEFKALQKDLEETYLLLKKLEFRVKPDGREFLPILMEQVAPASDGSLEWINSNNPVLGKSSAKMTSYESFMEKLPLWVQDVEVMIARGEFDKFR